MGFEPVKPLSKYARDKTDKRDKGRCLCQIDN